MREAQAARNKKGELGMHIQMARLPRAISMTCALALGLVGISFAPARGQS
jgi:hypothetical protein